MAQSTEKRKAYDQRYYQEHKEEIKVKREEWKQNNPEKVKAQSQRAQQRFYSSHRETERQRKRTDREKLRWGVLVHYSDDPPSCQCPGCTETNLEFLTIDHAEGDGNQHREQIGVGTGTAFYYWLVRNNYPVGFRVLCWNCNLSLGQHGYCPHNREVT